jgi:hypothetical protein
MVQAFLSLLDIHLSVTLVPFLSHMTNYKVKLSPVQTMKALEGSRGGVPPTCS